MHERKPLPVETALNLLAILSGIFAALSVAMMFAGGGSAMLLPCWAFVTSSAVLAGLAKLIELLDEARRHVADLSALERFRDQTVE